MRTPIVLLPLVVVLLSCGVFAAAAEKSREKGDGELLRDAYTLLKDVLSPGEIINLDADLIPLTAIPRGSNQRQVARERPAKLAQALVECMKKGFNEDIPEKLELDAGQKEELSKWIARLGAAEFELRESASAAILALGGGALPALKEALKTVPDPEVQARIKALVPNLELRAVVAKFRTLHFMPEALIDGDGKLEEAYSAKLFFEGPAWDRAGWKLYFTAYKKGSEQILRLDKQGSAAVWLDKADGANGQRMAKDGRMLAACTHSIVSFAIGENGPRDTKTLCESKDFNQPNDLWQAPDGAIYFTDPDFKERKKSAVWRLKPDGALEKLPIAMTLPNGLAVSPDGKALYVADSHEKLWRVFPIAADGSIGKGKVLFNPQINSQTKPQTKPQTAGKGDPDGLTLDENGNIYATGRGGVWVFTPEGAELGFIPLPAFCSNVTFGGEGGRTLYITGSGKVWTLKMHLRGVEFTNQ